MYFCFLPCMPHAHPFTVFSITPWFDYPKYASRGLRISDLLIIRFFPASLNFNTTFICLQSHTFHYTLCYKSEGRGFASRWCHSNFSST
jgi:hypothetical protein